MKTSKKKAYDFLFQRKHIMIEEFVQFFVGIIDAKLFKRIDGKIFEAENVQNAKEPGRVIAWIDASVDVTDEPCKRSWVQSLCHGMAILARLLHF